MNTDEYILLPDGTWAVLHRGMDWGEVAILLVLIALLFLKVYELWTAHRHMPQYRSGERDVV